MHSVSEENYIKAIYHLQKGTALVSTNEIAGEMNTKASSVTDMLKRLADKNLAEYIPYKGSRLTKSGIDCANQIVRKHRLWEVFLVEKLDFTWDEVHDVAEQLEHIQSRNSLMNWISTWAFPERIRMAILFLTEMGIMKRSNKSNYQNLPRVIREPSLALSIRPVVFLKYLDKHQIELGSHIEVLEREEFDGSFVIKTDYKTLHISQAIANNIYLNSQS